MLEAMSPRVLLLPLLAALACGGVHTKPLTKAGDENDEGAGVLANASLHLRTGSGGDEEGFADDSERTARTTTAINPYLYGGEMYGGDAYGGDPYGGFAYGGTGYANWVPPQWQYSPHNRVPEYQVVPNLHAAIEGMVTWVGPPPGKVASPCGGLIDNPTLHVGTDKAARGVVVYIASVLEGRDVPYYTRPVSVGGVVAKRGCSLVPAITVISPLPGAISIHGDGSRASVRVVPDGGAKATVRELQEGGLVQVEATPGVTRIDADDGKLSPAWVIGTDTPYYAVTDDAGRYRIDELAPGTYDVTFWQPPVASVTANGTWSYGPPIVVHRSVRVGTGTAQLSVALAPH